MHDSPIHGYAHWHRVASVGSTLADETEGADAVVVYAFAHLHDALRRNDGDDPEHGARAARWAEERVRSGELELTPRQLALLVEACEGHTAGQLSEDPTIGCCWDADRLDLERVGIRPDTRLLSTEAARRKVAAGVPKGPFFHGGLAGLELGDQILPRAQTGMPSDGIFNGNRVPDAPVVPRDLVHITLDLNFASVFAAGAPGGGLGGLYEVEPEEPLQPDLDAVDPSRREYVNWLAPSATVVRVVERTLALPYPACRSDRWMLLWWGLRQREAPSSVTLHAGSARRSHWP